jgi:hypothetical protein
MPVPCLAVSRVATAPTLDDPVWDTLPACDLTLDAERIAERKTPFELGSAKIAFDDHAVYLRIDFTDHDIVTTATADHDILYEAGDVAEWFIGTPPTPGGEPGVYLELHVAPNGLRTAYRNARPGLIEKIESIPFTAEVAVSGTISDYTDRDRGWSAQFTLPWSVLRELDPVLRPDGCDAGMKQRLTTLVARYNYGHHLPYNDRGAADPEITMWPTQPITYFHLRPFHAPLTYPLETSP